MLKRACIIVLCAAAAACADNGATPTSPTSSGASFKVSVQPSPVTAVKCDPACNSTDGNAYPYSASMTITSQESAGVGANLTSIVLSASTGSGSFQPLTFASDAIVQRAGTNHVSGRGSLDFPVAIAYSTGTASPSLQITVTVQFTDDNNHQGSATGSVSVR